MKIRLIGKANDSGIGTHFMYYAHALKSINGVGNLVELVDHNNLDAIRAAAQQSTDQDINIAFICAQLNGYMRGNNLNWVVYESTHIPDNIFKMMLSHNSWTPSVWGRKIAIEQGVPSNQIDVVPEGVDVNLFHPYLIPPTDKFRFLMISKYEQRKSVNEAIDAFAQVYGNNPDVELLIKSDYFINPEQKKQELETKISSTKVNNIRLIWGFQTNSELANLYRHANVFLFPTKAEGWGLPLIEAAATGLPLITTFHSGQTEFLQDIRSSCVLLNYNLEPIACPEYQKYYHNEQGLYGKWAIASVNEIARGIEYAYVNYTTLKKQAIKNSELIRGSYSWSNSAIKSLSMLTQKGLL
jgi:glycosyltransferase involved in cell wall biosynthesis